MDKQEVSSYIRGNRRGISMSVCAITMEPDEVLVLVDKIKKLYKWRINVGKIHEELEVVKVGYANGVAGRIPTFTDDRKIKND